MSIRFCVHFIVIGQNAKRGNVHRTYFPFSPFSVCGVHRRHGNTCKTLQNRRSIYVFLSIVAPSSVIKLSNELINKYCIRFNANENDYSASGISKMCMVQCTRKNGCVNDKLFQTENCLRSVCRFDCDTFWIRKRNQTNKPNKHTNRLHTPYESFIQTVWSQPTATVHVFCCVLLAISSIKYIIFCFNFSHQHHLTLVTLNNFSKPNRVYFNYYNSLLTIPWKLSNI